MKAETITALETQKWLVAVDIAGVQAKREFNSAEPLLKACVQKIKDLTHNLDTWYFQPFKPIDNTITVQPIEQPVSSTPSAR